MIAGTHGFASGSLDRHVKLWSMQGELWGDIVIVGEDAVKRWNFPYDWSQAKNEEKESVAEALRKLRPDESVDKNAIRFDEEAGGDKGVETKRRRPPDSVVPKRSLVNPELLERKQREDRHSHKMAKLLSNQKELQRRKSKREKTDISDEDEDDEQNKEKYQGRLAEDVAAMMDKYLSAETAQRKEDFKGTLVDLKKRMNAESQEIVSQFVLPKIRSAVPPRRPKEIAFPLHFAREKKPETDRSANKRYAISGELSAITKKRSHRLPKAESVSRFRGRLPPQHGDKCGVLSALERLDVTNVARNLSVRSPSIPELELSSANVMYSHGEVQRQMDKTAVALARRKQADIRNYQQTENEVATQQLRIIESLTMLPPVRHKKKL